jgi:ATP-binding cassette subfamily B protein
MVTAPRLDDLLRCFPFLADQPPDLLLRLSADAELQRFQQGQPICRTDHPPARIFLLLALLGPVGAAGHPGRR